MAGAGFKTFNTGDVLTASDVNTYLMQQTVMVFASSAARTTALGANVAEGMLSYLKDTDQVEVYNGSAWVSSDDPNAIQNTIVDAKGDIITATAADTPARLAVGSSGYTLVADSSTSTGLAYSPTFFAGKNKIINGDFRIWQRGTSFSSPSSGSYNADRFGIVYDGSGATRTISQQSFTAGTAPQTGYESQYFLRFDQSVAGTSATVNSLQQKIEDVRTFANETVTFSFWAKADSNRTINTRWYQYFGSGGSADVISSSTSVNITTSWARYSVTFSVSSVSGKTIGAGSWISFGLLLPFNTTFTVDTWGWQVESGSTATQFQTATGTIQGELAACQRYYFRKSITAGGATKTIAGQGWAYGTSGVEILVPLPVPMRTAPSSLEYSALNDWYLEGAGVVSNPTSLSIDTNTQNIWITNVNFQKSSAFTSGGTYVLLANATSNAYLGWSAEL